MLAYVKVCVCVWPSPFSVVMSICLCWRFGERADPQSDVDVVNPAINLS